MIPNSILVTDKSSIRYFSGFNGTAGYLLLHGDNGFLFTDARYHLVAKAVMPKHFKIIDISDGLERPLAEFLKKNRIKKLGFEGKAVSHYLWKKLKKIVGDANGGKIVDIGDALTEKRMIKKPEEIKKLARAQKITDEIFAELKKWMRAGCSEKDIAWKIECLAREAGADGISFAPIIAINENSAAPHHSNTDRKLKSGDMVLVDMGVLFEGYCSDMTRMIYTARPSAEQNKIYELVLGAQNAAIKALTSGITGTTLDSIARDFIKKAGYGEKFTHSLGHGVGLDIHELPRAAQKYKKKILKNSVVTVEPGIYLPGKFGVRIEDMLLVKANGSVNLTKSPKGIQDCVVRLK